MKRLKLQHGKPGSAKPRTLPPPPPPEGPSGPNIVPLGETFWATASPARDGRGHVAMDVH